MKSYRFCSLKHLYFQLVSIEVWRFRAEDSFHSDPHPASDTDARPRDEPRKPILLIDVRFKKERSDDYESVEIDGIMIDLARYFTLK